MVNNFGINGNGGTAVSKGLELAASVFPASGLALSLNGAYTDAKLTEDTDPVVGGEDGDPLPYVPEWSFALNADYEWTVKGSTRAYVGGTPGLHRRTNGPVRQPGCPTAAFARLDSFVTLDLRAGVYLGRWSVELYGKNLTNEQGVTSASATPAPFPTARSAWA